MREELLITLIGGVAVALIGGGISLALAILAKDQKTSEFRQAWIDELRNDVAKLVAHLTVKKAMAKRVNASTDKKIEDYVLSKESDFIEIGVLVNRVRLRMNKDEHEDYLKLIAATDGVGLTPEEYEANIEKVVAQTQSILKSEWKRVKRGELSFQLLKWGSALSLFASCGAGIVFYFDYFDVIRQAS